MSQPRRRRRRGRKRQGADGAHSTKADKAAENRLEAPAGQQRAGRTRRRRRRRPAPDKPPEAPQTLEDVVRAAAHRPTQGTTAPDDGRKLEDVIGELQSIWGVPQYPQEFRITVKVADERSDARPSDEPVTEVGPNGVMRERAPAAPRVAPASGAERGVAREQAPRRRRRTRRGRRRGGAG